MKNPRPIFLLISALMLTTIGYSQSTMSGKVVEVVDGKTVVIEISTGKLRAEIQYIEVPEQEQPLYRTVREHLEKLVMNKDVVFRAAGLTQERTLGQLYVDSVDIALQMLRDGAAWHIDPEKSGQKEPDSSAYQYHQNQARTEKRGVWGIKDMKPAWEYRAEKADRARQAEIAADYASKNASDSVYQATSEKKTPVRKSGAWSDINPWLKDPGPLMHGYNAASKTGYVGTSLLGIKELQNIPPDQRIACDVTYIYKQESERSRKGIFVLTLLSVADSWRFLKENNLKVIVDEKTTAIGKPKRTTATEDGKLLERLTYEVNKDTIEKIVYGGDVVIRIGEYSIFPGSGLQLLLYNMLQVAG